jgi:hypothetical protein
LQVGHQGWMDGWSWLVFVVVFCVHGLEMNDGSIRSKSYLLSCFHWVFHSSLILPRYIVGLNLGFPTCYFLPAIYLHDEWSEGIEGK